MHSLPDCMGVRVAFNPKAKFISDSRGIWRWKKVVVGPLFKEFSLREQQAILLHEVAHCKLFHVEQRLKNLWLILWKPSRLRELCVNQEHSADAFVRACGFGTDLASAFVRLRVQSSRLHPPVHERIARLTGHF